MIYVILIAAAAIAYFQRAAIAAFSRPRFCCGPNQ
jgi:hypothetical protein